MKQKKMFLPSFSFLKDKKFFEKKMKKYLFVVNLPKTDIDTYYLKSKTL